VIGTTLALKALAGGSGRLGRRCRLSVAGLKLPAAAVGTTSFYRNLVNSFI
jgi:hypothetical protein